MAFATLLTTSWDDGHPHDLRVADLLARHDIAGTFYVPRRSEHEAMNVKALRELASGFEIGAHTLNHPVLTATSATRSWAEIAGSKAWIEDQTGTPCRMFCPPQGRFSSAHLAMVRRAGFLGLRSVELLSLDFPRAHGGLLVMPTSVQAYPHAAAGYVRNAVKRAAWANLWLFVLHGLAGTWSALASRLLDRAVARGGVFHLWGHSWELQESEHWQRLDQVLRWMQVSAPTMASLSNGQICEVIRAPSKPPFLARRDSTLPAVTEGLLGHACSRRP